MLKKNGKLRKIIVSVLMGILFLGISYTVEAVDLSVKSSSTTLKEGESTTITITSEYTGRVDISATGGTLSKDKVWLENSSDTVTFKAGNSGDIKITATPSGQMSNSDGGKVDVGGKSVTIKVSGSTNNTPSNTGTNTNTNTGTNTNTNTGTNTNTTKPEPEKPKEPTFKAVNDKLYATGNVNVRKSYSADSEKLGALQEGEEVTRVGVGDNGWSKVSYDGKTGYVKTDLLTTEPPKKSEDKALKSLEIVGFEIDPAFDPEITDYGVVVGNEVDKIEIKATANDEKATVNIPQNQALVEGENLVKVTVTAEDQTVRTYTINVTREVKGVALGLTSLKVEGYTLSPKFSPDVYEYQISVMDPNVNNLKVTAIGNVQTAKIETLGNASIKEGQNTITVNVTSQDGSETATYKIIVNKSKAAVTKKNSNNTILYAGIGIIVFLIIAIIVVIIISKKKSDDEEDEYEEDYNENKDDDVDYSSLYGYSSRNDKDDVAVDENKDNIKDSPKTNNKDVEYYNNKVSELFDGEEDKTAKDAFGYLSQDSNKEENADEYEDEEEEWEEDGRPKRARGKHSK